MTTLSNDDITPAQARNMETNGYDLEARVDKACAAFPEHDRRPVVGITANWRDGDATLCCRYTDCVAAAGGVPVVIPPIADSNVIGVTLDKIDALVLSGGGDHNPLWMGEEPATSSLSVCEERDLPELLLTRLALNRHMPILGICRGIQTLVIATGGKIIQDIACSESSVKHSQQQSRGEATHNVSIKSGSMLHTIIGKDTVAVNSIHHQAVGTVTESLQVVARADDGVVEAVESAQGKPVIGVQWHPEWLGSEGMPLFKWLVSEARLSAEAKHLHKKILSVDTHCDTPMHFSSGASFMKRDKNLLVDIHKMTDGCLDAVTMAAFLPQPRRGEQFVFLKEGMSPRRYADHIFDTITTMIAGSEQYVALARTPSELALNKRMRRKSIMLGIENGLALEGDATNVEHFARRGVVYITLCHNGDNDICDSSVRTEAVNGGVSEVGAEVIKAMNRFGVMVDMSHAAEASFYDALQISDTPIVCSHSCCSALCNVARNLTDDQLRALAQAGGVAQITLYPGFLRDDGNASIDDFIAHIDHAVDIAGIDCVGIGSDFDGGGGVVGVADASECINITRRLLRRYSHGDIKKIWGGNWLRVMSQVQSVRSRNAL